MRFRIAQQARADLDEIWIYVAQESGSQSSASQVIESIVNKLRLLAQFPMIGDLLNPNNAGRYGHSWLAII